MIPSFLNYMVSLLFISSNAPLLVIPEGVLFNFLLFLSSSIHLYVNTPLIWFLPLVPSVQLLFWSFWRGPRRMIFCPGFLLLLLPSRFPAQFLAVIYTVCLHFLGGKVMSIGSKSHMFNHIYLLNILFTLPYSIIFFFAARFLDHVCRTTLRYSSGHSWSSSLPHWGPVCCLGPLWDHSLWFFLWSRKFTSSI